MYLEFNFHWIVGCMLGIEALNGEDYEPDPSPIAWGVVFDLLILRIVILVRKLPPLNMA